MRKLARVVALGLMMTLVLSLFVGASTAQEESVLVIGFEQEPPNLQPLNNLTFGGLTENFYARRLWEFDRNREIVPVMVTEIPTIENGMVEITEDDRTIVTITLRDDLQWSDGTPITTADCEVTHRIYFDRETSASVARGNYPNWVESFEAVDDHTFRITYNRIFPDYLTKDPEFPQCRFPAHVMNPILEEGPLEDSPYFTGGGDFDGALTVGYGPYKLMEWNIGESMVYEANEFWQGDAPAFDRVVVRFITDDTQMRNAMNTQEIDVAFNWSDDLGSQYAEMPGVEIFSVPGVYSDALWIRSGENGVIEGNGSAALLDPLVRQAIAHAIDRPTLAEELVAPGVQAPASWYPSQLWPEDLPFLEYNPERAEELLAEAGWTDTNGDGTVDKDGVELDGLRFITTENTLRNNYQLFIAEYLAEVGIGVDIQIIPATVMFASFADRGALTTYEWDLAIFANSADPLSPLTSASSYKCDAIPSADNPDGFNPWQFCDPEYDAVDEEIATTFPGPERDALIEEAVMRFHEGYFWHGLRERPTWWSVQSEVLDVQSVNDNVGTLASNWFNQIENWQPAN